MFVVYLAMKGFGVYDSVLVAPWLQGICAFSLHSFFSIRIYFIRISRLKFAKFEEYFKNKPQTEILKRIYFCVQRL